MARLTEQEQQEIVRFIEADKPLPERYRFLFSRTSARSSLFGTAKPVRSATSFCRFRPSNRWTNHAPKNRKTRPRSKIFLPPTAWGRP